MSLSIMANNLRMLWIDLCIGKKPRNKWDFSKTKGWDIRLPTISFWRPSLGPTSTIFTNFGYSCPVGVCRPCVDGCVCVLRCWGEREREKEQRGMTVNRMLSTSRMSRLWHGALQDMLFVAWPSVYFKDRRKPEKWGAQLLLRTDGTTGDVSGSDKLVRRWLEYHDKNNMGNESNRIFIVSGTESIWFWQLLLN